MWANCGKGYKFCRGYSKLRERMEINDKTLHPFCVVHRFNGSLVRGPNEKERNLGHPHNP